MELVIGNKNYSSWSMRPWVLFKHFDIPFVERQLWLDTPTSREEKLRYSPTARVPVLVDDGLRVWDSLAIVEYLAERCPDRAIWPSDRSGRARARSLCAEMHAGFATLRAELPLNCRARRVRPRTPRPAEDDIRRITEMWGATRREFGAGGDFLFGAFCAADAFYAPVASRFLTYAVELDGEAERYRHALLDHPAVLEWMAGASEEGHVLESVEALL